MKEWGKKPEPQPARLLWRWFSDSSFLWLFLLRFQLPELLSDDNLAFPGIKRFWPVNYGPLNNYVSHSQLIYWNSALHISSLCQPASYIQVFHRWCRGVSALESFLSRFEFLLNILLSCLTFANTPLQTQYPHLSDGGILPTSWYGGENYMR